MDLVEWTRREGGEVEAVVAMLVNREQPNSVRITPSRGDGGVDILDRTAGPGGSDVVYQVKRYTGPLTSKQKDDIEDSLATLAQDPRWADLDVVEWHLVLPWNPTPEAENWLQELGRTYKVTPIWHGLDYVEQLAAKYPDVIDVYLRGGRARIEQAYREVAALLGADRIDEGLTVPEVTQRVQAAVQTLDHDPHYRYELGFGDGEPPPLTSADRPHLVMRWMLGTHGGGPWITVDVIARCAASAQARPITVKGQFVAEPGSDFAQAYEDFVMYGAPLVSPEGAFQGELDAPGGLGGPLNGGTITTWPVPEADLGDGPALHLEVLDPDDNVLAAVDLQRIERSQGLQGGLRVVLQEQHGVFTIDDRYNLAKQRRSRTLRFGDVVGKPVAAVLPALTFATHLHPPNKLRLSVRHTPAERGTIDPHTDFDWTDDVRRTVNVMARAVENLATLQEHTSTIIRVPDFLTIPPEQPNNWRTAAAVLRGEEVTGTYPEGQCVVVGLEAEVALPADGEIRLAMPFRVSVGDQVVDLGWYELILDNPTLLDRKEISGYVQHAFATPDRGLRWRRHIIDETDAAT